GGGRRFQSVGANQRAAWVAGLHVRGYVVLAYVLCSLLGGVSAILLSGFIQNPQITLGDPYLLGPVAAVVIAGASLLGGLASTTSTWVAAFALTLLIQVLRVLGLTSALQFVVFGSAIIVGMVISGDRIADLDPADHARRSLPARPGRRRRHRRRVAPRRLGEHDVDVGRRLRAHAPDPGAARARVDFGAAVRRLRQRDHRRDGHLGRSDRRS